MGGGLFGICRALCAAVALAALPACSVSSDRRVNAVASSPAPFQVAASELEGLGDPLFAEYGNPGYDVQAYDWRLHVDPETSDLDATAVMAAIATEQRSWISLDFEGPAPQTVRLDGASARFHQDGHKLVIEAALDANQSFEVAVDYRGTPRSKTREGLGLTGWQHDGERVFTTSVIPGDTSTWAPLNDTPLDPATYTLRISTPDGYEVAASGRPVGSSTNGGIVTSIWKTELPVTEIAFAVGRFDRHTLTGPNGLDIDLALPADGTVEPEQFERLPQMIDFLTQRFGPFPFPTLGITWISDAPFDGDASPARIHLSRTSDLLLVHELAHQWMGAAVGNASSRDIWLREGIPTYAELLWTEHTRGPEALEVGASNWMRRLGETTRPPLRVQQLSDRGDDATYLRSALALHALRREVGDRAFFAGLVSFFEQHPGTSVTTRDFIDTLEAESGQRLQELTTDWLDQEAVPALPTGRP